jgi:hypothetical protein
MLHPFEYIAPGDVADCVTTLADGGRALTSALGTTEGTTAVLPRRRRRMSFVLRDAEDEGHSYPITRLV